jgi:exopolysaccharide production protein ExoZ
MTKSMDAKIKLGSLEVGRFIAAVMVLLSHVVPYVNNHTAPLSRPVFGNALFPGPLGVQYFFVLSGFVMASTHYGDFGKFSAPLHFWWRRACRIYPAYWLALCIPAYYLFGAMTPGSTLHLAVLDPWHDQEYIPAAWTMRFEMAFYIMFGLCLLPYIGKPLLAAWVFVTLCECIFVEFGLIHSPLVLTFLWWVSQHAIRFVALMEFYFFAGLAAGFAYVKLRLAPQIWAGILMAGTLLFCGLLPLEGWGAQYGPSPVFALGMACVLGVAMLGLAGLERAGGFTLGRFAGWLGAMSYPIYVFHEPVLLVISNALPWGQHHTPGLYLRFIAIVAAILTVAALVTFLFDQPLQRFLRRLTRRMWPRPAPLYSPPPSH